MLELNTEVTKNHSDVFAAGVGPFAYLAAVFCALVLQVVALSSVLYILFHALLLANDIRPRNQLVVFDLTQDDIVNGYEVARFVALSIY